MSRGPSAIAEHHVLASPSVSQLLSCTNASAIYRPTAVSGCSVAGWVCYYSDNVCCVTDACVYEGKHYQLYDKVKKDCNSWLVSQRFLDLAPH